jgi:hypothetical protein
LLLGVGGGIGCLLLALHTIERRRTC